MAGAVGVDIVVIGVVVVGVKYTVVAGRVAEVGVRVLVGGFVVVVVVALDVELVFGGELMLVGVRGLVIDVSEVVVAL